MLRFVLFLLVFLSLNLGAFAQTFSLIPGNSIQATIDAAVDGDFITLQEGLYQGDIDFAGKNISIIGQGRNTIIRGSGKNPVVTFNGGESFSALLDQVRIVGGRQHGAVLIEDSSPRLNRSWIVNNRSKGNASGILVINGSPAFFNNVIANNKKLKAGFDPHQVYIEDASPSLINNTIIRGDSNGILVTGDSAPRISNNIIAYNGKAKKGRGICIISNAEGLRIDYNLFFQNRKADIFAPSSGGDLDIQEFEDLVLEGLTVNANIHDHPHFVKLKGLRSLALDSDSAAIDAGDPDELLGDLDGSRNDIGASGGLFSIF